MTAFVIPSNARNLAGKEEAANKMQAHVDEILRFAQDDKRGYK